MATEEESMTTSTMRSLAMLETIATPHGVDSYLEQINPVLVIGECRATVVAVDRETEDATTLRLRANRAWQG